jgi:hypothetical protein
VQCHFTLASNGGICYKPHPVALVLQRFTQIHELNVHLYKTEPPTKKTENYFQYRISGHSSLINTLQNTTKTGLILNNN